MDNRVLFFVVLLFVNGIVAQSDVSPDNQTTTVTASTTTSLETTTETTTTSTTQKTTKPTTTAPTTPAPSEKYFYNVTDTETNTTCIMIDGEMFFNIKYSLTTNGTSEQTVTVPKPSKDVSVSGTCKADDGTQNISISWGAKKELSNSVSFIFNASDGMHWSILSYTAEIAVDETFKNATDQGKILSLAIDLDLAPVEIPVNNSLKCYSRITASNVTAKIDDAPYIYSVNAGMDGIQIQAFNFIPKKETFVFAVHCDADKTSDIVPIAVGCALAGLVIIVLIAYLVGRRRRSAAYQSV